VEPVELSILVADYLLPFLPYLLKVNNGAAVKISGEEEEEKWDKAREIWKELLPRLELKEAARESAEDLANSPDDEDAIGAFRLQVRKLMLSDTMLQEVVRGIVEPKKVPSLLTHASTNLVISKNGAPVRSSYRLPKPPENFTGRENEIDKILNALSNGCRYINITGVDTKSGLGKLATALHIASKTLDSDAQVLVNMQGSSKRALTPAEAMESIIYKFHPDTCLASDQITRNYRDILIGKEVLIILENASDIAHVRPLLPPYPSVLIVTSNRPIKLPGMQTFKLDIFSKHESREFLKKIIDGKVEEAMLDDLGRACERLPMAMHAAALFIKKYPEQVIKKYIEGLDDEKNKSDKQVNHVILLSVERLYEEDPAAVERFCMLLVFPADLEYQAAGKIWGTGREETIGTLVKLHELGLLDYDRENKRYKLHNLVRSAVLSFSVDKLKNKAERLMQSAHERHAAYYETVALNANNMYLDGGDSVYLGISLFDTEWANIRVAQVWSEKNSADNKLAASLCTKYPVSGRELLRMRQHPNEQIHWLESALIASRILKEPAREAELLKEIGGVYTLLKEPNQAIEFYEKSLVIAKNTGNIQCEESVLNSLGLLYAQMGEVSRAMRIYEKALAITVERGNRRSEGDITENLGSAYAATNEPGRAIEFYEKALAIAREVGNRLGEGNVLGNLGLAYASTGKWSEAIAYYEKTLCIAKEICDRTIEGNTLCNMGLAYVSSGDAKRSIELYNEALIIAREIGSKRGEGNMLSNLGDAYIALKDSKMAAKCYERAIALYRSVGSYRGEANVLVSFGKTKVEANEFEDAALMYEQALTIYRNIGSLRGEAKTLWNTSLLLEKQGNRNQAIAYAKASLNIYKNTDSPNHNEVARKLEQWQRDKGWRRWLGISRSE